MWSFAECSFGCSVGLRVRAALLRLVMAAINLAIGRGSSAIWQPLFSTQQMKSHSGHTVVRRHAPLKLCLIGSVLRIASDWFSMWCSLLGGPARSRCPLRSPGKHRLARDCGQLSKREFKHEQIFFLSFFGLPRAPAVNRGTLPVGRKPKG